MRQKQGFSLVELMVVMAITAVIISLGLNSLVGLRDRTFTKQTVDEFVQNFNSIRSDARNNILPRSSTQSLDSIIAVSNIIIDIKGDGQYYKGVCSISGSNTTCAIDKGSLKSETHSGIKVTTDPTDSNSPNCGVVSFSLSRGEFSFGTISADGTYTETPVAQQPKYCVYLFSNLQNPTIIIKLKLNKLSGTFKIQ